MGILNKYNSSQTTTNAVSDASKKATKYDATILKKGSSLVSQVTSPTAATSLAPAGGVQDYTQQVFQEAVK